MSYRNPKQVVDTQTGQHYANLQKTIAGSFGNYTNAVSAAAAKANDKRRKEEIENQKAGIAIRNKMFEDQSKQRKDFGKDVSSKHPTINYDYSEVGIERMAFLKSKQTTTPAENQEIFSYATMGSAYRASTINLLAGKEAFINGFNTLSYRYGAIDVNAPSDEVKNNVNLYKLGSESLKYETKAYHKVNGSNTLDIFYDVVRDGEKTVTHSGTLSFDYIVPNFKPFVDQTIAENIGSFNYKDGNDPIYKDGEKLYDTAGKLIGVFPNKKIYKEKIRQSVSANLLGGQSRLQATMLNNNIFDRNPENSIENARNWTEFIEGDTSKEKETQDTLKKKIVDNGLDFIANQNPDLIEPYMYKQGEAIAEEEIEESAEDAFNDIIGDVQNYLAIVDSGATFNEQDNTVEFMRDVVSYTTDSKNKQQRKTTPTPMTFDLNTQAGMQEYVNSVVDRIDNLKGDNRKDKRTAIKKLVSKYFKGKKQDEMFQIPSSNKKPQSNDAIYPIYDSKTGGFNQNT
jgi:hypothetical protein